MKTINVRKTMDYSVLEWLRGYVPDSFYLSRYLAPTEIRVLYPSHHLDDPGIFVDSEIGKRGAKLISLQNKLKKAKTVHTVVQEMEKLNLDIYGKFKDGDVCELPEPVQETNLESLLEALPLLQYVKLPWNKVRLDVNDKGYFVCFGWIPATQELVYAGPDFVPTRTKEELAMRLADAPRGRGLPDDIVQTRANCGPSALAAYLNISTEQAIELIPLWKEKGWINPPQIKDGLEQYKQPHKKIKLRYRTEKPSEALGTTPAGLLFVQFTGSLDKRKYSGWRCWNQEAWKTHWIAFDGGQVYDINAEHPDGTRGDWITEEKWLEQIVPKIMPEHATGHYVKHILIPQRIN
ncbi:hypothetical protein HY772_08495 [Candidatus Woesearchaeota archaeon]|nr:hypothetical protein [Candidatus Woesearchaeota archaeon]